MAAGVPAWWEEYPEEVVERAVLVVGGGRLGVEGPLPVDDILVLVGAGEEREGDAEVDFPVLVALAGQLLHRLPLGPTASDQHFGRHAAALGLPDEARLLRRAWTVVVVAALLTRRWHRT
jgi:hypothetical protein